MSLSQLLRGGVALGLVCTGGLAMPGLAEALPVGRAQPADEPAEEIFDLGDPEELRRFGVAQAPERAPGTIRLATYNVENLFDDVDDPALSGRNEDIDDEKPAHELEAIARAITMLDADVLCLQEIESESALLAFRDAYLSGLGYEHVASIDAGAARGIEQSVLSRFPITDARNWPGKELGGIHPDKYGPHENWEAGNPIAFRRSPLMVDVEVPAGAAGNDEPYALTVVVVHHKSGRHADYWREAESRGVLEILGEMDEQHPERNIAVLGDFNNTARDKSVRAYLDAGMVDLGAQIKGRNAATTHESNGRIDLILVNEDLMKEIVPGSVFVLGTAARPSDLNWRDVPTFKGYASDHYPMAVDIRPVEGVSASGG